MLVLGLVVALAGTMATQGVSDNAVALHRSNAAAGSLALMRAAVSQAMLFVADHEVGLVSDDEVTAALAQAEQSIVDMETWTAALADRSDLDGALIAARQTMAMLASGDVEGSAGAFADLENQAAASLLLLQRDQASSLDSIAATEGLAGKVGLGVRIAMTLILPVSALLVHRQIVRRRFREAKVRLDAEREAQRVKEEFIAGVSHQLRTPLTAIFGFSSVLAEAARDTDMIEMAATIRGESGELARMVEDLIAFAAAEEGVPAPVDDVPLRALVDRVLEPYASRPDPIIVEVPELTVVTDSQAVEHVLRNLVSNAKRHGGDHIAVSAWAEGQGLRIVVSDDGAGCDPQFLKRATLGPFRNEGPDAVIKGSIGLGLSVASMLARRLGGSLDHRRAGEWTQFSLLLPGPVRHSSAEVLAA